MNKSILHTDIQNFISEHLNTDINSLILKGSPFPEIDIKVLIEQIEAKKRSQKKLPSWFNTPNIYFPNKLNIEQTSSETAANYKAGLISGKSIIDITGGFGVDCLAFSKRFNEVIHCEINAHLSEIVSHNYQQLHINNIVTVSGSGLSYLQTTDATFDWIYIDPSRRHDSKGKVFFLNDCLPNVPEHLEFLFSKAEHILVKTSPLLDIAIGISELKHVSALHIIAVNNEVKELLWVLEKDADTNFPIHTANITKSKTETFSFLLHDEENNCIDYQEPDTFLFEPNSAILKAGGFNAIALQLQVGKLHKHSHLYTSKDLIAFPGRRFKIIKSMPFNKKTFLKEHIEKANITTRNFPDTVQNLRKKLKVKDGGNLYLFFTTNLKNEKIVLICEKI